MRFIIVSGTVLLLHLLSSCSDQSKEMADASFANLIPKPVKAERGKSYFRVPADLNIYVAAADTSLLRTAQQLEQLFSPVSKASIQTSGFNQQSAGIHLQLVNDSSFSVKDMNLQFQILRFISLLINPPEFFMVSKHCVSYYHLQLK